MADSFPSWACLEPAVLVFYWVQGWHEGAITFNPTYKYHLGCNIYSGDPLPPGVSSVKAVDSYASLTDSEATTEGESTTACRSR